MHSETYFLSKECAEKILFFLKKQWPIIFVGTTSFRTVESFLKQCFPNEATKPLVFSEHVEKRILAQTEKWHDTNYR
jgi:S-adenosylmethionine:tRNA-ribosyltransferase-isomerase (queuine synthetase)